MALVKSNQIDLNDLATRLANIISNNPTYKSLWNAILSNAFVSYVFSLQNSNISIGQTNFLITYATVPIEIFVFRNGVKQVANVDYTFTQGSGNFTITLSDPINSTTGAILSEEIEIQYY